MGSAWSTFSPLRISTRDLRRAWRVSSDSELGLRSRCWDDGEPGALLVPFELETGAPGAGPTPPVRDAVVFVVDEEEEDEDEEEVAVAEEERAVLACPPLLGLGCGCLVLGPWSAAVPAAAVAEEAEAGGVGKEEEDDGGVTEV